MGTSPKPGDAEQVYSNQGPRSGVLPDFCSTDTVIRVFAGTGLLTLAVALLRAPADPLAALAPMLLFVTWVGLSSLLILCLMQRWLRQMSVPWQLTVPAVVPILNTALVHLGAEYLFLAQAENRFRAIMVTALLSIILLRYLQLHAAWHREIQIATQAREQAMRARVRPHFLFNSMNTIASLCRSDPAKAEQVTLDLADLFRATFATGESHSLSEELRLARAYLDTEKTRFGERLELEWRVTLNSGAGVQVPALVLLPLVENAIQHGIAPTRKGGHVSVFAQEEDQTITVEITNSLGDDLGQGTQTAGEEVRARLLQRFGEKAQVDAVHTQRAYRVRIVMPLEPGNPG